MIYRNSFHGSVLRIDVHTSQDFHTGNSGPALPYAVPDDNPFIGVPGAKEEIFAVGVRNMWGCSLDSKVLGGKRNCLGVLKIQRF